MYFYHNHSIGQRRWYGMDQTLMDTGRQRATVKHGEQEVMQSRAWLPLFKKGIYFSNCPVAAPALTLYCALRTATLLAEPKRNLPELTPQTDFFFFL